MKNSRLLSIVSILILIMIAAACGRPSGTISAPNPQPQRLTVGDMANYNWIAANIIQPKCSKCHAGDHPAHGIDLSTYEKIMNSTHFPPIVTAGNPDNSLLYTETAKGDMPKNAPHLSADEVQAIGQWIHDGAVGPNGETSNTPVAGEPCDSQTSPGEPVDEPCHAH